MPVWKKKELSMYYEVVGEGTPLVFLHGLGGSISQPKGLLDNIKGIQYIFIDQRAHGETNLDSYDHMTFNQMGDDVVELMDFLGNTSFMVGGISMGAAVSINIVLRYPELIQKLILIRPAWLDRSMDEKVQRWYRELSDCLITGNAETFSRTDIYKEIQKESAKTAQTFLNMFQSGPSLTYPGKYRTVPGQRPFETMELLKQIQVRTLVLANQTDPVHPYSYGEMYASSIPDAKFVPITSKEVDEEQHKKDINSAICGFI